jgi:hypothetical protein
VDLALALVMSGAMLQDVAAVRKERREAAELTKLEQVWNEAHLRGDAEALDRLWAADFVATVPKMKVLSREEALAMARFGRMLFDRYETSDLRVRIYGDAAVVTGRLRRSRKLGERVFDDDWRFTKAYVRREGQWRVAAFHASEAAP